jgi:hypothetical protein
MLFYATRSLILSKLLAGRISVQAINEKVPTTMVLGLSSICRVLSSVFAAAQLQTMNQKGLSPFPCHPSYPR